MKHLAMVWAGVLLAAYMLMSSVGAMQEQTEARLRIMDQRVKDAKTFRASLRVLQPTIQEFEETFPERKHADDIYTLYRLLGLSDMGLTSPPERMSVSYIGDVERRERIVGAIDICLTSGSGGYRVEAPSLALLTKGLETMLETKWMRVRGITVQMSPGVGVATATLSNFCVTLRDDELLALARGEA